MKSFDKKYSSNNIFSTYVRDTNNKDSNNNNNKK